MGSTIRLRAIDALLSERFIIPSYQRGYRWTKRQVVELLEDLREFAGSTEQASRRFYCLQPIVVRWDTTHDAWEVIDGQQRLTTIALFMAHQGVFMNVLSKQPFVVSYDTRPTSAEFLAAPDLARRDENIDFWHMAEAWEAMDDWLAGHQKRRNGAVGFEVLKCLTAPEAPNAQVIWYELPPTEDPIAVFIRLNVGKIPLTSAELIRALFLRQRNFEGPGSSVTPMQIAHEWDAIEKRLQTPDFWGFVQKTASPDSDAARIEYLFEIKLNALARRGLVTLLPDDKYGTFIAWQRYIDPDDLQTPRRNISQHWDDLKFMDLRLNEWFSDRDLYHLVGTCIAVATEPSATVIVDLVEHRDRLTRTAFEAWLKGRIYRALFAESPQSMSRAAIKTALSALTYSEDRHKPRIRIALLLFNVATLMRNAGSNLRFDFQRYKSELWDLEHIRSVTAYKPVRFDQMRAWLENIVDYWDVEAPADADLLKQVRGFLAKPQMDRDGSDALYTAVRAAFGEGEGSDVDDTLGNLTLLDAGTNRGYQNAPFPVKRRTILDLDKTGTFAPLCTTNVFLKYYSSRTRDALFWQSHDAQDYFTAIVDTLSHFFLGDAE